ncbi:MAG TPA: Uma2 family endonuclease [Thermoanaerobaculia bacterium]|nr:Uma2 family endonuclease [Thermoanaerobaculia bacterium]
MKTEQEAPLVIPGVSEEEFYSQDEDSPWEYLDGELVMEPASFRHEDLFAFLITLLRGYLGERGGAVAMGSRFPMRLDEKWSPEPDLLVVREERRHLIGPQRLEGPADLVIEIVSGAHPEIAHRRKLPRYREAQVPEIWTIDPFTRSTRVDILAADGYDTQILTTGRLATAVAPGFWIDVAWLWQEPLPPPLFCLRQILA